MTKSLRTGKVRKVAFHGFIFLLLLILVDDFDPVSIYSSRQKANQVPYGYKTRFWSYLPFRYSAVGEGHPVLISLHGGSAIGDDLDLLFEKTHENPPQLIHIDEWYDLPFIVVSPQMRRDPAYAHYNEQYWPDEQIDELIEFVRKQYNVDSNRIYLTGISSGAAATWCYPISHPEKIAAILPMGGQSFSENACALKDLGVWAFHGENDIFVPTRFTREMIAAANACTPPGKYVAHANVSYSIQHEVWDQVFNMTGGYDVFNWLLSFRKGDTTNISPFVFTGLDRKMKFSGEPFYLTAEYFDSDGSIQNVQWSQVNGGKKNVILKDTQSKFLHVSGVDAPGVYTFRLEVTDNDGAVSSDEVSITLLDENESHAVLALLLTNQNGTKILDTLTNDKVYDLSEIGNRINIRAVKQGFNYTLRWGVNSDQNTRQTSQWHARFWKDYAPEYLRATDDGPVKSGWAASPGEYLVCATMFDNGITEEMESGTSLCYKITLVE